jgi:hypothetical protein
MEPNQPQPTPAPINLDEVSLMLGEARINIFIAEKKSRELLKQIEEMAQEITRLRGLNEALRVKYGELGKPVDLDTIRRFPGGVQGEGRGRGDDVPQRPNVPSDGGDKVCPSE